MSITKKPEIDVQADGYMDYYDDSEDSVYICPSCGGTGLAWEGWDCEECDGYGYWEW